MENRGAIAVFQSETEFLLARTRLQSADIECFGYHETMLRIGWHAQMFGEVRLPGRESETHDAGATLQPSASPDNP